MNRIRWGYAIPTKSVVGLLLGLAVTAGVVLFYFLADPNVLELKLFDFRQRIFPAATVNDAVVLVLIDDPSLEQVGRWPWRRRLLAEFVSICTAAQVRQVVLDILLPEEQPIEPFLLGTSDVSAYEYHASIVGEPQPEFIDNDAELTAACFDAGNVVIPFHARLQSVLPQGVLTPDQQRVREFLAKQGGADFETLYHAVFPEGDILVRDLAYQQLLRDYIHVKAMRALQRFSMTVPSDTDASLPFLTQLKAPVPCYAEAAADTGFVTAREDSDGAIRGVPLLGLYDQRVYKHLAFTAACRALGMGDDAIDFSQRDRVVLGRDSQRRIEIPLDRRGNMLVAWPDLAFDDTRHIPMTRFAKVWQIRDAIEQNNRQLTLVEQLEFQLSTVPADESQLDSQTRLLAAQMREQLSQLAKGEVLIENNRLLTEQLDEESAELEALIRDKIVLVGSVATAVPDFFVTARSKITPGVMIHHAALNSILQRHFIGLPPRGIEIAVISLAGLVITLITTYFRPLVSGLTVIVLAILVIVVNFAVYATFHTWVVLVSPLLAVAAVFMVVTFYRQISEGYHRRFITGRFKQYVSPSVVDKIVSAGGGFSFAGERREITCYFSDLAGFTSISERLGPEPTVSILNRYLDRMTECLDRYDATINKFQGDGIFAFFGAPVVLPNPCDLACQAALAAQEALAGLVEELRKEDASLGSLAMRIGICTGPAIVGDCGSHRRFDYTAIGDTVNLASRLESANKYFGTSMMISGSTYRELRQGSFQTRYLGRVKVVGKQQGVDVYELQGAGGEDDRPESNAFFESAVRAYQERALEQSLDLFQRCAAQRPHDKAVKVYLDLCRYYLDHSDEPFDGCVQLTEK